MSLRTELKRVSEQFEARNEPLTADALVKEAQAAEAYPSLHAHFWGVSEAALAHEARLARAHRLIISIRVIVGDAPATRLLIHTQGQTGYRTIDHVVKTFDLAAMKLRELQADIVRARARLREFKDILPEDVSTQIEDALATAERATTRTETTAQLEAVA